MSFIRIALWENVNSRAVVDDTLGELVVRQLSRESNKAMCVTLYKPCLWAVRKCRRVGLDESTISHFQ